MEPVRPLRDLFGELAHRDGGDDEPVDPRATLQGAGHPDLPPDLVAEALVSYASTAPAEVAEQLGPFVTAHSGVPSPDDQALDDQALDDQGLDAEPVGPPSLADAFGLLTGAAGPAADVDPATADPLDPGPPGLGADNLALDGLGLADVTPDAGWDEGPDDPAGDLDDPTELDARFGAGEPEAESAGPAHQVGPEPDDEPGWGDGPGPQHEEPADLEPSVAPEVLADWGVDPGGDLDLADDGTDPDGLDG